MHGVLAALTKGNSPGTLVDLDFRNQPYGPGSVAAYGLTHARAAGAASVRWVAAGVPMMALGIAANTPRFGTTNLTGLGPDSARGYVHEPASSNLFIVGRDPTGSTAAGAVTVAAYPAVPSDDGTANAYLVTIGGATARLSRDIATTIGQPYTMSGLYNLPTGAGTGSVELELRSAGLIANRNATIIERPSWSLVSILGVAADATTSAFQADGRGLASAAFLIDCTQVEQLRFATEYMDTTGAPASRPGDFLSDPNAARWLTGGTIRFYALLRPKGDTTSYGTVMLWWYDANNFVSLTGGGATAAITATIGGVSIASTGVQPSWNSIFDATDPLELWVTLGGGIAPRVQWRNGSTQLTTATTTFAAGTHGPVTLGASPLRLLGTDVGQQFGAYAQRLAAYRPGFAPTGFAV